MSEAISKLDILRKLDLPPDLFDDASPQDLELYRKRVAGETAYELRRHPDPARLTWLATFAFLRARAITDNLADLLIETMQRIAARAERRVEQDLLEDFRRVTGKPNLLFQIAEASLEKPDDIVRNVVYPVVNEQTLRELVKEWKATGPAYRSTLRNVIRSSYKSHYRQTVPNLIPTLAFRSNNELHRPVIEAIEVIKRYSGTKLVSYPVGEAVPLDGVVNGFWRDVVVEEDAKAVVA